MQNVTPSEDRGTRANGARRRRESFTRLIVATSALVAACTTAQRAPSTEPGADAAPAEVDASTALRPKPPAGWDAELKTPELEDGNPDPNVVEVKLEARVDRVRLADAPTEMWTYNGLVPGPVIRAKKGDRLIVHFTNALPEATTIHWHGVRLPNDMDGVPTMQAPIPPGGSFDYAFVVPDEGTFWYHPHVRSSAQVGYGLYGALVVEEPKPCVEADDLVLVLSDASVRDGGALDPGDAQGGLGDYFGREGDLVLVNGRPHARLRAQPGLPQRWRLVNAARARYLQLRIPSFDVLRLGGDMGVAERPRPLSRGSFVLAPGERIELYVVPRPSDAASVSVTWEAFDRFHAGVQTTPHELLEISLEGAPLTGYDGIPARLATLEPVSTTGARERTLRFIDASGRLGIDDGSGSAMPMLHVNAPATEVWTIRNDTGQDHPFHLHGFSFQVLEEGGSRPAQLEWRDTVNVVAQKEIRIAIPFDERRGEWMLHCHVLDHADSGMMAMLMVE